MKKGGAHGFACSVGTLIKGGTHILGPKPEGRQLINLKGCYWEGGTQWVHRSEWVEFIDLSGWNS